jgi:Dolichyl-phosphate-mannose-protein mannosyltransferase
MIPADMVPPDKTGRRSPPLLPVLVLLAGFAARLFQACAYFLNPDEALHNLLASQASVNLAYKAALTNAHPPLLILVLYYWRCLGQSEWMLRMPSVLAGTACCWLAYLWLKDVTDRSTAFLGLLLLAFAPALVGLSAEVRQYALLLFFMSGCLYLSERALRQNSALLMILFSLSLYGALLVHYSSLLFAFTMGGYMAVRLYPYRNRMRLTAVWAAGQVGGVVISGYFVVTHVMRLRQSGMTPGIYDTWLRKSIFHSGGRNPASFAAVQTLRVFTYLFSHGVVGTLALLAFLAGMILLVRGKIFSNQVISSQDGPRPWQLALLFGLGFAVNCGAALAGQYPYGATRHSASLFLFAVSGACIGLAPWARARLWVTSLAVALCLMVCNFFPAPPPAIRPRNQARALMQQAVASFRQSAEPGSLVFADYQSGLLFGYYVCGHGVVQVFEPLQAFAKADCGSYTVITTTPEEWKFYAQDTPEELAEIAKTYNLAPGTKLWLFDAGWITDSAPALREKLKQQFGCAAPRSFGENIFLCELQIGNQ